MPSKVIGTKHATTHGLMRVQCVGLFEVSPRVVDKDLAEIIPWDVSEIPETYRGEVPQVWKDGIATGDAGWVYFELHQRVGETPAELATYMEDHHFDAVVDALIADTRDEAAETGDGDPGRFELSW